MHYMAKHGTRRSRPAELVPGTVRVISARLDYLNDDPDRMRALLDDDERAYVSRYALGRDYHKVIRRRLQRLADRIAARIGEFGYRVFVDSAPVLEKPLAEKAGLGWIGKHTNLIDRDARARGFFSASCIRTCHCPSTRRRPRIAAAAMPASTFARPVRSWRPTNSTRGSAFPT